MHGTGDGERAWVDLVGTLLNRRRAAAAAALAAVAGAALFYGGTRVGDDGPQVQGTKFVAAPTVTFTAFRTLCLTGHRNFDDPIVYPGNPGVSHQHQNFGNVSTDFSSTYVSMVAAETTCDDSTRPAPPPESGDTAGYWMPVPVVNGEPIEPPIGAIFWYRQPLACGDVYAGTYCAQAATMKIHHTFPKDLRVVIGAATATSADTNPLFAMQAGHMHWNCYPSLGVTYTPTPNECKTLAEGVPGGARLDLWLVFPACWDGVRLDSPNHRDHLAYTSELGCPATHPVVLPQLFAQIPYTPFNGSDFDGWTSGADYTAHFDFWNAWDQARLVQLTGGVDAPTAAGSPPASVSPTRTR